MSAGGATTRRTLVRTPAAAPSFAAGTRAGVSRAGEPPLTAGASGAPGALRDVQAAAESRDRVRPSRPRPAGVLAVRLLLVLLCGGFAFGAATGWGSKQVALFMGDFGLSGAGLLAAVSCVWYSRANRGTQCGLAWLLFGVSALMAAAGNAVWGWYEVVLHQPVPHPSAADFCFLLFAPPAIIGLLVLAKRPVTRAGWVCLGLDSWLIGGSLLTISWSLALVHTTYWQGDSVAEAALSLAYPLLDIVLVSMVLVLHFRRSAAHRTAVNTAIGALVLTVLCDALFTSPLLREHYTSGQMLDAGWFAGSLLLAYAPWAIGRREAAQRGGTAGAARRPHDGSRPIAGSLTALLPYVAAAVCTLGILYNAVSGRQIDRVVLFTACTVVLALVVRQGLMLLDNMSLTQELAEKENHFRSLVQGSSDVIMIASPTGMLRYVSPAAAGVYGRDGDALIGSELASLIHPEDLARVLHELRRFLATPPQQEPSTRIECRVRHGRGHWLNVESTVNRYRNGLIFNSRDVTERVRLQAQLQHNASHDPLTDLPNRALFTERVRKALVGRRGGDSEHAVLFIDLDGFKLVNDSVGHQAGDELLVAAARRLQESVREGDTAARLGGDEFAVLILGDANPSTHAEAEREQRILEIADRLRLTLSEPYVVEGQEVRVAASIGIAFAEPGITPTALMRNADLAMYRAKQAGKARVMLHVPGQAATPQESKKAAATTSASSAEAAKTANTAEAAKTAEAAGPVHAGEAAEVRQGAGVRKGAEASAAPETRDGGDEPASTGRRVPADAVATGGTERTAPVPAPASAPVPASAQAPVPASVPVSASDAASACDPAPVPAHATVAPVMKAASASLPWSVPGHPAPRTAVGAWPSAPGRPAVPYQRGPSTGGRRPLSVPAVHGGTEDGTTGRPAGPDADGSREHPGSTPTGGPGPASAGVPTPAPVAEPGSVAVPVSAYGHAYLLPPAREPARPSDSASSELPERAGRFALRRPVEPGTGPGPGRPSGSVPAARPAAEAAGPTPAGPTPAGPSPAEASPAGPTSTGAASTPPASTPPAPGGPVPADPASAPAAGPAAASGSAPAPALGRTTSGRGGSRSLVVAGALPVRLQEQRAKERRERRAQQQRQQRQLRRQQQRERRESAPQRPTTVGDVEQVTGPPAPCPHAETPVPPT